MINHEEINLESIVKQNTLHTLEAMCTAEDAPACLASCPLHVDARELCRLISNEDFKGADALYKKTVPFPNILSHTCDAPCMGACKREKYGGSIELQELEKAAVTITDTEVKIPLFLPKKAMKAAVIGAGLRGLTAAHDLARKGYKVTIIDKANILGSTFRKAFADIIPEELIEKDLQILNRLRVNIILNKKVNIDNLRELNEEYDGIFISCHSDLDIKIDKISLVVEGYNTVLAFSNTEVYKGAVHEMFWGRKAAFNLDRIFQKVNIMAGRENEGSYETKLYTDVSTLQSADAVIPAAKSGYTKEEAAEEASRCILCKCDVCMEKCAFLKAYGKNPRQYIREVYNNLSIAMGTHHANEMINSCALCSQCSAVCPNGLDMKEVFIAARMRMVETKKMPPSAFEFGLLDLEYSMSKEFYMAKHQKGFIRSSIVFFPGCQLAASEPELVKRIYEDLIKRVPSGVGLMLSCCGIPAKWAGEARRFERVKEQLLAGYNKLGSPLIVAACPTCAATLSDEFYMDTIDIFTYINAIGKPENTYVTNQEMRLHHACGARYNEKIKDSVASLISEADIEKAPDTLDNHANPCCGYGGLVPISNSAIANDMTRSAIEQTDNSNDILILTYCVNCRDRYLSEGREAFHLLELLYPDIENTRHKMPSFSMRQDNRYNLKLDMKREFWNEKAEKRVKMKLLISKELEQKLEETHILHRDIEAVITHAEQSGERLIDERDGHCTAYLRIGNVTFWVEYQKNNDGLCIYNAYSHRMEFILDDDRTKGREN